MRRHAATASERGCSRSSRTRPGARGCTHVFVTSFTFQAPGFYERHGYREIFRWEGVPAPEDAADVHFRKDLWRSTASVADVGCDDASLALDSMECQPLAPAPGGRRADVPVRVHRVRRRRSRSSRRSPTTPLTECPTCGGRLRKVFSAVGVVFKGSGFYRNDSRDAKPKNGESTVKADAKCRQHARPTRSRGKGDAKQPATAPEAAAPAQGLRLARPAARQLGLRGRPARRRPPQPAAPPDRALWTPPADAVGAR